MNQITIQALMEKLEAAQANNKRVEQEVESMRQAAVGLIEELRIEGATQNVHSSGIEYYATHKDRREEITSIRVSIKDWMREEPATVEVSISTYGSSYSIENDFEMNRLVQVGRLAGLLSKSHETVAKLKAAYLTAREHEKTHSVNEYEIKGALEQAMREERNAAFEKEMVAGRMIEFPKMREIPLNSSRTESVDAVTILRVTAKNLKVRMTLNNYMGDGKAFEWERNMTLDAAKRLHRELTETK